MTCRMIGLLLSMTWDCEPVMWTGDIPLIANDSSVTCSHSQWSKNKDSHHVNMCFAMHIIALCIVQFSSAIK